MADADAPIRFGRVPADLIDPNPAGTPAADALTGIIAVMHGGDAKVYLCLCAHLDANWQTSVSQRRIAKLTGLHRHTVTTAMQRLRAAGLIDSEPSGRGMAYRVRTVRAGADSHGHDDVTVESRAERDCPRQRVGLSAPARPKQKEQRETP